MINLDNSFLSNGATYFWICHAVGIFAVVDTIVHDLIY